ncbi:MAG: hypothetical protein ABL999_07885 [Pyrinomonadaceae bacterium]
MQVKSYDQMIDILTLWKVNLPTYQTEVGATAADITWATNTLDNMVYVRDYTALFEANKKSGFDVKASFFNGPEGSAVSDFAAMPAAVIPHPPLVGGVLYTFRDMIASFKLGPGYTEEIGIALGIDGEPKVPTNPMTLKPTLAAFPAQSGAVVSVVVGGRADSNGWKVEILRSGGSVWQDAGNYTGKSADVHITLTTPGQPEQIQIRVWLRKNNEPYGLVSDAVTVTINP